MFLFCTLVDMPGLDALTAQKFIRVGMTAPQPALRPTDWASIRLVAFDVDGTLYRQRPLRLRMARDLAIHVGLDP